VPGIVPADDGRYRLLVDSITDYAVYMLDPGGHVISWNPGAQRFKGYTESEILGQHFSRFFTEEDRAVDRPGNALRAAAAEGRFESEGWRIRKDGTRFWAHAIIDTIRAADGTLLGFAKITRDLSERREAELALRRSEERFRLLVQSVTDYAIYMLDAEGRVSNWNTGAQRIKGYTPEEIIGQHFSKFYSEEDRAKGEPERGLATALREGRFEKEGWRIRKDGTRFWANIVIDPIRDEAGNVIGFAKVTRDITERMEAQKALEQAREAFFQSQKAEALGQLTGGIAHDFNNLLMVILSSLELLQKRVPDDPKIARLINNALQGAQRGASLTQRMLAFARRQELEAEPVDVAGLVQGMMDLVERSLGPAVTVATAFPHNLPRVIADANQLELALLNLAVNARDAMPNGGPIAIAARAEKVMGGDLDPGLYVCLSVTDSGTGMDPETLARAVEPFFTTKGVGKGTGLGLSMVHGMAEQLGGRFVLRSTPGKGTTAEIWLRVAAGEGTTPAQPEERDRPEKADTAAPKVLVVDDDPLVLVNMATMLEDGGYAVLQAGSGVEALAILRRAEEVDVVITDQAMPNMTGSELAETIRAERPGLPIILASGYAELPAGSAFVLPRLNKPFRQFDLLQVVEQALEGAGQTA